MRNAILTVTLLMIASVTAGAQITINFPNIKKVRPVVTTETTNVTTNTNTNTTNTNTTAGTGSTNWWIDYQIGEITKYKQSLDEWNPSTQYFPKPKSNDDYITLAFSKNERASWLQDKKVAPDAKLDAALDGLKVSLNKRLPEYTINPKSFTNRNAAEEKLMLAEMSDVPGMKVFKIGLNQANWIVDKNDLGIPKAR